MNILDWIVENIAAIAAIVSLLITTITFVIKNVKSKNWSALVKMVLDDMIEAEKLYSTGAERKEWVMSMLVAHAKACNYDLTDEDVIRISKMIDDICAASKTINAEPTEEVTEEGA